MRGFREEATEIIKITRIRRSIMNLEIIHGLRVAGIGNLITASKVFVRIPIEAARIKARSSIRAKGKEDLSNSSRCSKTKI